jgi:hypothetical protein
MKFKVGDKVKVIATLHKQACNVGDIVTIKKADVWDSSYLCDVDNVYDAWFYESELGAIENGENNSFTKSDLKDGDIVTYKNGIKRLVNATNKKIVFIQNPNISSFDFCDFRGNLTNKYGKEYDIVKIERLLKYETVFKREEEILDEAEKKYLADVIRPFRKHIMFISKIGFDGEEFLKIDFKRPVNSFSLPFFEKNSMYKGMKVDQKYTLEELGI